MKGSLHASGRHAFPLKGFIKSSILLEGYLGRHFIPALTNLRRFALIGCIRTAVSVRSSVYVIYGNGREIAYYAKLSILKSRSTMEKPSNTHKEFFRIASQIPHDLVK